MRDTQNFKTADPALIRSNNVEILPRGNRSDKHIDCAALNSVILAGMMHTRGFDVVFRDHVFVLERGEKALDLRELRFFPDT